MTTERSRLLDKIIERNLGQPVGKGYIDIIVRRAYVSNFVDELSKASFRINGVSWWEYCRTNQTRPMYGIGGPHSTFFDGWYAEIPISDADLIDEDISDIQQNNDRYLELLLGYEFRLSERNSIKYEDSLFLTPAFYIDVPSEWENWFHESPVVKSFKSKSKLIRNIINQWDPIGLIELGAPSDEYDVEINDFLPKILSANPDVVEIANAIRYTFVHFFEESYKSILESELKIANFVKDAISEES